MGRIFVFLLIVLTACAGLGKRTSEDVRCSFDPAKDSIQSVSKGFCGPDSYRITATGVPAKSKTDRQMRRKSSVYAATLMAHYSMYMDFEGGCIEQSMHGFPAGDIERKAAWKKKLRELVKKGKVVYTTCDEKDNCTVLYELRMKGLKKKILTCGQLF